MSGTRRVDGVEVDAVIQDERARKIEIHTDRCVLLDVLVRRVELRLDDARGLRRGVALVLGLLQLLLEFDHAVLVLVAFFGSGLELGAQRISPRAAVVRRRRDGPLDAAVAHQKELQDALDAANKQLKKEAIVIASKDEFIKTLIQTPAAA